ncbi:MAG: A/G-specific adenine glycosylase [Candidatus Latescibacteria bacterium]|nr:A/G-specific adenine glycosylase [Candidatus Latescibacterota bacterium]
MITVRTQLTGIRTLGKKSLKKIRLSKEDIKEFREKIYSYYNGNPRNLTWRNTKNPYFILVSEVMLQQTQVDRVIPKYEEFIDIFPDFNTLAHASLQNVLQSWQGLGYNRRAVALHKTAKKVMEEFSGILPQEPEILQQFPGIGSYTACAIAAFAFDKPSAFIETNIRSVYIHFFFGDHVDVNDRDLLPLVEKTLDKNNPREWYYALMDYGVMLKKKYPNPSRKSSHHQKQSPFKGSNRQIRGKIIRLLTTRASIPEQELLTIIDTDNEKIKKIIEQLINEGLIGRRNDVYFIE